MRRESGKRERQPKGASANVGGDRARTDSSTFRAVNNKDKTWILILEGACVASEALRETAILHVLVVGRRRADVVGYCG